MAYDPTNPEGKYKELTRENLAKIYWRMNELDINSDLAIDNFMMITHCDLYKENYSNDFKWPEIRKNARISIAKHKDSFPQYIRIVRQIYFDRYDPETETFKLSEPIETSQFGIKATDSDEFPCKNLVQNRNIELYPHEAVLDLSTPIKIEQVTVPTLVAFQYNSLFNNENTQQNTEIVYKPAYLVQDIKIYDVEAYKNKHQEKNAGTLSAILENLYVYGDPDLAMLLYSEKFR
jgi:hypothetical protein